MDKPTDKQLTKIHNLENLANELDKACISGSIDTERIALVQQTLNETASTLIEDKALGTKASIIYEVQGLIHWVNGDYDEADALIGSACRVKKSKKLYTESATRLAAQLKEYQGRNDAQSVVVKIVGFGILVLAIYFIGRQVLGLTLFFNGIWTDL